MEFKVDVPKVRENEPQERHFDVRDLNFDCDTQEPDFLCSLRIAE